MYAHVPGHDWLPPRPGFPSEACLALDNLCFYANEELVMLLAVAKVFASKIATPAIRIFRWEISMQRFFFKASTAKVLRSIGFQTSDLLVVAGAAFKYLEETRGAELHKCLGSDFSLSAEALIGVAVENSSVSSVLRQKLLDERSELTREVRKKLNIATAALVTRYRA